MPKKYFSVLLVTVTLLYGTSSQAEIFKWVDANGMTHYGDSAPQSMQSETLDFGQLRRPSAPRSQPRETRISFPEQPRAVTRRSISPPKRKVLRQSAPAKRTRIKSRSIPTQRAKISKKTASRAQKPQQQFKEFQLTGNSAQMQTALPEAKPNLDAKEYDLRNQSKNSKENALRNLKLRLCTEKRMQLAALQETGFKSYYDDKGHYRLTWGGDGIYQGKRRFLSAEEVAKKTKKAMFEVEQYCENPYDKALQETARANWIRAEYCVVSKAVLEDLEHPFMRAEDSRINKQKEEVKRFCAELAPGRYRSDNRYYPTALLPKVALPRHLTLKEEENPEVIVRSPEETLEQLLALIQ